MLRSTSGGVGQTVLTQTLQQPECPGLTEQPKRTVSESVSG